MRANSTEDVVHTNMLYIYKYVTVQLLGFTSMTPKRSIIARATQSKAVRKTTPHYSGGSHILKQPLDQTRVSTNMDMIYQYRTIKDAGPPYLFPDQNRMMLCTNSIHRHHAQALKDCKEQTRNTLLDKQPHSAPRSTQCDVARVYACMHVRMFVCNVT